jgi:hypothetical protein
VAAHAADLGGGTPSTSARDYRGQLTLVTLRTAPAGTAIVRATVPARCGVAHIARPDVPVAAPFAFTATTRERVPQDARARLIARVKVQGTAAGGTVSARIRLEVHGRTVERCNSGTRNWQARTPVAEPVAGPPRANTAYFGLTAQPARPHALVLRVSAGRVQTVAFQYRLPCTHRVLETDNLTPGGKIAADGTFHLRERFSIPYSAGPERFRVKVDGHFTPAGANGTLSVSSTFKQDHCATGAVQWAAVP